MRIGIGNAQDLFGIVMGGITACNITLYSDGSSNYNAPFTQKGFLYLNGSRVTNSYTWDGKGNGDWSIKTKVYLPSVGATGNRLFEIEDAAGTNRIDCAVISGTHRFGFKVNGGTTVYISGVVVPTEVVSDVEIRFSGLDTNKLIEVYINDVSVGSLNLDISTGWVFERYALASSAPSGNDYISLFNNFYIDPLDSWLLKSNQDSGLTSVGNKDISATITEVSAGDTQYPGIGYTWPDGTYDPYPVPVTGDIYDDTTYIGYRDPITDYFSGHPTEVPVTPTLSGANDRPVGSDYIGSHITLSEPILHTTDFDISFYVNSTETANLRCLYGEAQSTNTIFLNMIATNSSGKIYLFARQSDNTQIFSAQGSINIFDGINHLVRVYRSGSDIIVSVDGVEETLVSGLVGELEAGTTSTIGACETTVIQYDFTGIIWDFNKNGTYIPINEGTGTDIKDSTGTSVGTLVDPSGTFWDYSVSTWTLVEDKPCDDNPLILDKDTNTAMKDKDTGDWLGDKDLI